MHKHFWLRIFSLSRRVVFTYVSSIASIWAPCKNDWKRVHYDDLGDGFHSLFLIVYHYLILTCIFSIFLFLFFFFLFIHSSMYNSEKLKKNFWQFSAGKWIFFSSLFSLCTAAPPNFLCVVLSGFFSTARLIFFVWQKHFLVIDWSLFQNRLELVGTCTQPTAINSTTAWDAS